MSTTQTKGLTKSELYQLELDKAAAIDRSALLDFLTKQGYIFFTDTKQNEQIVYHLEGEGYVCIEGDAEAVADYLTRGDRYKVLDLQESVPVLVFTDMGLKDDHLQEVLSDRLQSLGINKLIQAIERL